MKILIIKFRNIGDVLLVTPLLGNLKASYPESTIDFALNKGTESMIDENPNIDRIFLYERCDSNTNIFKRLIKEINFFRRFRHEKYDLLINLTEGDRGAIISKLSSAKLKIGYQTKSKILNKSFNLFLPLQQNRHTIESNLDPVRLLDLPIKSKSVEIFFSADDLRVSKEKLNGLKDFIHIHPVSRWLFKCISDKTMAEIIDYCEISLNRRVVITSGPDKAELERIKKILLFCNSDPICLAGQLTLKQTAALNSQAEFFIGVDTAIMHISAANNIPVLAFFGPSGAHHWGPWDNLHHASGYVFRNGVQRMGRHIVISESRHCQPCGGDGCNGSKISDCLMHLNFELIKECIEEISIEKSY